ncbi:hypothetical protein B1748_23680 [Paenibacillus sp. MY03]|nr:hypothetical protein B1748_23680 [Paenibacillus sp. MY03]
MFEGDFYRPEDNGYGIVKYEPGRYYIDWVSRFKFGSNGSLHMNLHGEVIGNRWDHPHLLKGEG